MLMNLKLIEMSITFEVKVASTNTYHFWKVTSIVRRYSQLKVFFNTVCSKEI